MLCQHIPEDSTKQGYQKVEVVWSKLKLTNQSRTKVTVTVFLAMPMAFCFLTFWRAKD